MTKVIKGPKPPEAGNSNTASGGFAADFVMAVRFFSRLPIGGRMHEKPDMSRMAMALPFASLLIAIGPAALLFLLAVSGLDPLFSAVLAAAAAAVVGGAMSEDAIGDAADGLFGGSTPERRLAILKDSRHGTYGVLAIVFAIGLKIAALTAIAGQSPFMALVLWPAAVIVARSCALYLPFALAPARADGASAAAGQVSRNAFATGLVFAVLIGLVLAAPLTGLLGFAIALIFAGLLCLGWTRLCSRLLGGQTGDLIGALQALLEIAVLGTFMRMVAG